MHWNGNVVRTGGVGGIAAWEGAIPAQLSHLSLVAWISVVTLGQNTDASALAIMWDVSWWAAWSDLRKVLRRFGGITTRSLYVTTPSMVDKCFLQSDTW